MYHKALGFLYFFTARPRSILVFMHICSFKTSLLRNLGFRVYLQLKLLLKDIYIYMYVYETSMKSAYTYEKKQ